MKNSKFGTSKTDWQVNFKCGKHNEDDGGEEKGWLITRWSGCQIKESVAK